MKRVTEDEKLAEIIAELKHACSKPHGWSIRQGEPRWVRNTIVRCKTLRKVIKILEAKQ